MIEDELAELRASAFAIAYRMLGSISEAEDMVQEGLLRLHGAREGGERSGPPRAYLSTVVRFLSSAAREVSTVHSARLRRTNTELQRGRSSSYPSPAPPQWTTTASR